jgi:hypothetical protein
MKKKFDLTWEEVCQGIAQCAINIAYGPTTIEPGSRSHRAMEVFCEYMCEIDKANDRQSRLLLMERLFGDVCEAAEQRLLPRKK